MREDHQIRISTREKLWLEQNKTCIYCNKIITKEQASLDHIIPVVLTEENYGPENLVVCCKKCNKSKGDYIIFCNLYDKIFYPIIEVQYFFRAKYIQTNKN